MARNFGAFIVPVDSLARGLRGLGLLGPIVPGETGADVLSLLGFPDFLRDGRARAARRSGVGLPDVQEVLGEQATITNLDSGGGLTFGQLPLLALALVLFSTFLLVGAVMPPAALARTRMSAARYAQFRQPFALAAIGILVPVAVVALLIAIS